MTHVLFYVYFSISKYGFAVESKDSVHTNKLITNKSILEQEVDTSKSNPEQEVDDSAKSYEQQPQNYYAQFY